MLRRRRSLLSSPARAHRQSSRPFERSHEEAREKFSNYRADARDSELARENSFARDTPESSFGLEPYIPLDMAREYRASV